MLEFCPAIPPIVISAIEDHIEDMDKKSSQHIAEDNANVKQSDQPEKKIDSSVEIGGSKGPEPTRYGDWEKGGRCTDF